jgi:ATP-dependent helicase/nuclease subunit B
VRSGARFGVHRSSLTQLAAALTATKLADRQEITTSALGLEALGARAIYETQRKHALRHFQPVANLPGFTTSLVSTLTDLRSAHISVEQLEARNTLAATELARLLQEFEQQLQNARSVDGTKLLDLATDILLGASLLPAGASLLMLDVPVRSTTDERFVRALTGSVPSAFATIPLGDKRTRLAFEALGARFDTDQSTQAQALGRLRRNLFTDQRPSKAAPDDSVQFRSAPGEGRECVEVARWILDEARDGVPLDDMAIILRTPESYWSLLEHALARARIPAYFSVGTRRPEPSGRAFLALLDCAGDGLSAARFSEYLSLGQTPAAPIPGRSSDPSIVPGDEALAALHPGGPPEGTEVVDETDTGRAEQAVRESPWKWEAMLVESAVIGGDVARWRRRLAGLGKELGLRLAEARRTDPQSPLAETLTRQVEELRHLGEFALPIVEKLSLLPVEATWGEWLDVLEPLVDATLRRPDRVLAMLADLRPMSRVGPIGLQEVRAVLRGRLSALYNEPPPRRFGRVFIGTPDQLRGRSFRIVFALGMAERMFPQRVREDPLLLDNVRAQLSDRLPVLGDKAGEERLLLRLVVGAAAQRLYLSYPRVDVLQGRPRVTSFYALDVMRAITGEVPDHEHMERGAAHESDAWLAWPAPRDPNRAIDEAEHDLAVLRSIFEEPDSNRTRGAARYLFELNPRLARSLRSRFNRWQRRWSANDGLMALARPAPVGLSEYRLTARPYSVSALQRFAICPYQFLLGGIYRLEPRDEPAPIERLDPLTRGALFHEIQRDLLRRLMASGDSPLSTTTLSAAHPLLEQVVDEVSSRYRDDLMPAIDRVWQEELRSIRVDLRGWLERLARSSPEWAPRYVEFAIGMPMDPNRDPASITQPAVLDSRFQFRGVVDLIEESRDRTKLRVTDTKTGKDKTRPNLIVDGGLSLQPVIYSLAVEQVLRTTVNEARLFFSTTAASFAERTVVINDHTRRAGIEVLELIDRAIEHGRLPAAPSKDACEVCAFYPVCGPLEELRIRRKDPSGLLELTALRSMP